MLKQKIKEWLRAARTEARILSGREPSIPVIKSMPLEFHGHRNGGWCIAADSLTSKSIVVDVGLGEDVEFSWSLQRKYRCVVHGFDPTPKALAYQAAHSRQDFAVHPYGVGSVAGSAQFFLPANEWHVSGAIAPHAHLQQHAITVQLLTLPLLIERIGAHRIDLLKLDIEGAEFDLFASTGFHEVSGKIDQLCVELHHRWPEYGVERALQAARTLGDCGFFCAWRCSATNEEFLFVSEKFLRTRSAC